MGVWRQIAALPNRRYNAAACFHDDKVYLFGGRLTSGGGGISYESTHYVYDPAGNTWATGPALPTTGLCYAFSTASDGIHLIYPATGAHYAINPADTTPAWATRTSAPATDRVDAHHFTDAAGLIYLAGGRRSGSGMAVEVHRYDVGTNVWTTRADMPTPIASRIPTASPGVLGSDDKVYVGHSSVSAAGLIVYNPTADTWATTAELPEGSGAADIRVSRLPSGIVLVLPHQHLAFSTTLIRRIDGYDPATGLWTMGVLPDFPGSSYEVTVATEPGGLVFLIGGNTLDASGVQVPTTASWAYQQNEAPTAPTQRTMVGGVTVSTGSANRAAWTFNDPNAGDSQSKFNLYYRVVGDPAWITVTRTTPNSWYDFAAGTLDAADYEWQVEAYDAGGLLSPRTASAFFTAADPPDGPSITAPINGATVEQQATVVWSAPAQTSYQLRRVADSSGVAVTGTVYFDTGEVTEPLTRSLAVEFETNARTEHVQVRVKSGGLWSVWVDVLVEVSYTPPPTPTVTLYVDPATASLLAMIANPEPVGADPAAAYNDVYVTEGGVEERRATQLATNSSWRYWTPISGADYEHAIRVVAVAANGTTASST